MVEPIMVACDLHDRSMLLKIARGRGAAEKLCIGNTQASREKLVAELRRRSQAAGGCRVIFAYEASGLGFGLYDRLVAGGIECHVLAPTKIERSSQQRKNKTDEKDAQRILELLRAHVLAGNPLPDVWVPDAQTRDDREVVRLRQDLAEKITQVKLQVRSLLKRYEATSDEASQGWGRVYRRWLADLAQRADGPLAVGGRGVLASLLKQLEFLEKETEDLEKTQLVRLAESPRYAAAVRELTSLAGVGLITALVFLTEMGSLQRFQNRRQVAAYLGLAPSSFESGQCDDRKGHISRQGPSRVRRVLCQATWARVREGGVEHATHARLVARKGKHKKKIAVVAGMRKLAILMWHRGQAAAAEPQQRATRRQVTTGSSSLPVSQEVPSGAADAGRGRDVGPTQTAARVAPRRRTSTRTNNESSRPKQPAGAA